MPYSVKVAPEVARLKPGDAGTRRRAGITFNRHPTILARLPPEVAADSKLIVEKIKAEKAGKE